MDWEATIESPQETTGLPAPHKLLAELIHSISTIPLDADTTTASSANPLRRVPLDHRPLLATLHVLFPALLLPALDLLDRRRVVRWGPRTASYAASFPSSPAAPSPLYQIRGDYPHVVHLRAWHCTCAFFALKAATASPPFSREDDDGAAPRLPQLPLAFSTPPCKHLLACLLAEEWAALDAYIVVGEEETARTDGGDSTAACSPETLAGIVAGVL